MTSKLIREDLWKKIRDRYNNDEKSFLRAAFVGSCICPPGSFINLDLLNSDLRAKIENDLRLGQIK